MGKLCVLEVPSGKVVIDMDRATATNTKWSPAAQRIVGAGVSYGDEGIMIYSVTVPEGKVTVIAAHDVLGDVDFSWSPDSRWIVYARPTRLHHVGDTMVSDLWIADPETGASWCVVEATDHHQSNPLWITGTTIQVDRVWWTEEGTNREQRVVLELRKTP